MTIRQALTEYEKALAAVPKNRLNRTGKTREAQHRLVQAAADVLRAELSHPIPERRAA